MKAMIIPGNGDADMSEIWYPAVRDGLTRLGLEVIAENMPDPMLARAQYWLPFVASKVEPDSILIGHSSGAIAIMRYLETRSCSLAMLVGAYYTDLGMASERQSGYFDTAWNWAAIRQHAQNIAVFASTDDPLIPIAEARYLKDQLQADYHEYSDQQHFSDHKTEFPEIVSTVQKFLAERS